MKECKGLRFRAKNNSYYSGNNFYNQKSMKLLKRQSCDGCVHCQGLLDYFKDFYSDFINLPVKGDFDEYQDYTIHWSSDGEDVFFVPIGKCIYK